MCPVAVSGTRYVKAVMYVSPGCGVVSDGDDCHGVFAPLVNVSYYSGAAVKAVAVA